MTTKNNRARNGIDYFMDAETRRSYGTYYKEIMGFITLIRSAKTNELLVVIDTKNKTCVIVEGVAPKTKSVWREWFAKNDYIELNGINTDYYQERGLYE